MGRGRIVNALSFFVFLKNVFLNRHSCYYRIDNLNLRFAFLKLVISATIAVTILPNHLWIGRCRGQQFVVGSYNKKGRNLFCDRFVCLFVCCKIVHIKDQFLPYSSFMACYFCIKTYFNQIRNEIKGFSKYNS